ncbi:branched-chain amino acid ABC transporter substrate-binding protein [Amylibacter kogurei]|uniref:Branched-chain amino acid ABC transporter substrate-binding protein n=1 Tax=Paramylibacter kogurei TaxID=1889778 RepID=A0A2G5K518_9RHOB|nr:ABC transporter substrate-binding protein [Amylibacter kogurei]PIB24628.1 branched-chain amino acid ABC transporter substrate-binding protein [Amylibacter kogurei]
MKFLGMLLAISIAMLANFAFANDLRVSITYVMREQNHAPTLSNLDPIPTDLGVVGAKLGLVDNQTTGKFLGHDYALDIITLAPDQDISTLKDLIDFGETILVANAPTPDLIAISQMVVESAAILFNASAMDNALRNESCLANMFHTAPSHAMLTDALAQFAFAKKWQLWAMIVGPQSADQALATSFEKSINKFGIDLVGRKDWTFDTDMRRSASNEIPLFTQDFKDHQLLVVADETNDFARYVVYNTWLPRPVAGSVGLVTTGWARSVEQYGAVQLQNRFSDLANRDMRQTDYASWAAIRAIGEAVTRTNTNDLKTLKSYLLSDEFALAGFKGRKLSFRSWNGQMRQPIVLAHHDATVAMAPLAGFLHQYNELDTLGLDQPESNCTAFQED